MPLFLLTPLELVRYDISTYKNIHHHLNLPALPEGVSLSVHEHERDMEEERWVADPFIDSLRGELDEKAEEKAAEKAKTEAKMEAKAQKKKEALLKSLRDDDE